MRSYISTHVLDLLQADARLLAAGNAWAAGFAGVRRIKGGDVPRAGCVNLFDHVYSPNTGSRRPAIYLGTAGYASSDRLEFASVSSQRNEFRLLTLPLIVCAQANGTEAAEQQRDQLAGNVRTILLDHLVESGYWYALEVPGDTGGGAARILATASATGQATEGLAEAMVPVPLAIRYTFRSGSPA